MSYESILNLLNDNSGHLITSSNAHFDFDAVTVQQHISKLKLTDNPIEENSIITDHAVLEPKELTMNGIMVGYTPPKNTISNRIRSYPFINYILPIEVKTMTLQAEYIANRISSTYYTIKSIYHQIEAEFLPTYKDVKNDFSSLDRIANGYEMLLELQRSGELLTFQTPLKQYTNMMIISISATQQTVMSGEFSIAMREVFVVNTKKAAGLKQNLGVTQPKEIDEKSVQLSS